MSEKIWFESDKGRTRSNWEYYAEADARIKGIRDRFKANKVNGDQVLNAVSKITGFTRVESDWKIANDGKVCPKGRSRAAFEMENFEAWLEQQPQPHRRIYGDAGVIAAFILGEK